jgi:hypothetical protein
MAEKIPVILDNRNNNTVLNALQKLLPSLQKIDIATGVFEVGSLLQLEGLWQQVLNQCVFLMNLKEQEKWKTQSY